MCLYCDGVLPPKENPFPGGCCPSVLLEEMFTEDELVNGWEERSVEEKEVEKGEKLEDRYPFDVLVREISDGDVWEINVVIGMTVEENTVGITEVLKAVEIDWGDGEKPRRFLVGWVDKKNGGEVGLAWVLPSDTDVMLGVVNVVASVWPAGHRTHI